MAAKSSMVVLLFPPIIGVALACAKVPPSATPPPEGWVQTSEPDEATLKCANGSRPDWMVRLRDGAVAVGDLAHPPSDFTTNREPLPFRLPEKLKPWGGVQVLKLSDGFLVGSSAGEFGGRLVFFAPDGHSWRELSQENVTGLVAVRGDEILVLHGINHGWTTNGYVRWLSHGPGSDWLPVAVRSLDSGPEAFAVVRDDVYILTHGALYRVTPDRQVENLGKLPLSYLYPNTMVADRTGALWIGMRYFLLRLVPLQHSVSRTWFIRDGGSLSKDHCAYWWAPVMFLVSHRRARGFDAVAWRPTNRRYAAAARHA